MVNVTPQHRLTWQSNIVAQKSCDRAFAKLRDKNPKKNSRRVRCKRCAKEFKSRVSFLQHSKSVHVGESPQSQPARRVKGKRRVHAPANNVADGNYKVRGSVLLVLGFKTYQSYLDSHMWREIRQKVLIRDAQNCQICSKGAECCHHISYDEDTMRGISIDSIVSLCHSCHEKVEFGKKGGKCPYHEVKRKTLEMLSQSQAKAGTGA